MQSPDENWARCQAARPDVRIAGCTAVIASGRVETQRLVEAYVLRGSALSDSGDNDRALRDFNEALQLAPNDPEALNCRCWSHAVMGELAVALADCDHSLELRPGDANTLDSRGFAYLKMGRLDDAIADYDAGLAAMPGVASSLFGRGVARRLKGDRAGGQADIAAATKVQSDIGDVMTKLGVKP